MLAPAASSEVVVGKHRVLAVLISFGPRPFPRAGVTAALDEAAAFIHRSSFARLTLQTTTTPWLAGGTPPPSCDAPPESMFGPLRAIATAGGFPTSRYDRILYVVAGPDRGFHGIEFGNEVLVVREPDARLIIHELGHTFGLLHAGASTVCGRWCVTQEQGDLYSPMGSGVTDFSAYEKEQLGWIPRQPRVARRGRYLVYPSSRSIGRQALVVDAPEGEYWLEQRPGRATPGLIVRIVDQVTSSRAFIAPSTLLLAPIRTGHPVITPGQTFRVEGEFTVTVARTSAAPLRLNLTLAGGTSQPPTVLAAAVAALALAAPTVPQGNLLKNPGAEAGQSSQSGETTVPIPGWQTTSTFTVAPYGGGGAPDFFTFPPPSESQRIDGGRNFFAGGFQAGTSTATQTVDTTRAGGVVDAGQVTATLVAWLGGFLSQPDPGTVVADFLAADGGVLGSVEVGPVTPEERDRDPKFVQQAQNADVPPGTRKIRVTMTAIQQEGTYDDAYFDNLALALHGPGPLLTQRCFQRHRVTLTATAAPTIKLRIVTFRANGRTFVDKKRPFTASFVLRSKSVEALASGAAAVNGKRAVIPGRLVVHCP